MRKICWSEGLFLRPHHMQFQDVYHDERSTLRSRVLNKYFWGVHSLELNEISMHTGQAEITRCELLLRDGTILKFPGNTVIPPRDFTSFLPGAGKPVSVFLGIRKQKQGEANRSTAEQEDPRTRFVERNEELSDLNTGENPCTIPLLDLNGKLFFTGEEEQLEDYDFIEIAQILETGKSDPPFEMSKLFVPPCLTISSSRVLYSLAKRISDMLVSKAKILTEQVRNQGMAHANLPPGEMFSVLLLQAINSNLPAVQHCVSDGSAHPFSFYTLVGQVFGSLSTYSSEISSWEMTPYDHQALGRCYEETAGKIYQLLDLSVPTDYDQITMEFDGEFFCASLTSSQLEADKRFFLAVKSSSSTPEALQDSLPPTAKISARENMEYLISHALGGVPLQPLPVPPSEIPQKPGTAFFRFSEHETQWDAIRRYGNIAINLDVAPEEFTLDIFILS